MANELSRASVIQRLEEQAELLNAHQLDLVAQIETHLRAVHQTMRRISSLRSSRHRVGRELTNGEKRATLDALAGEIEAIENQINLQQDTCREMQTIVHRMQEAAGDLRLIALRLRTPDSDSPAERDTP